LKLISTNNQIYFVIIKTIKSVDCNLDPTKPSTAFAWAWKHRGYQSHLNIEEESKQKQSKEEKTSI